MLTVQRCNAEQRKQKCGQRGYSAGIVARGRQRGVAGAREREKGRRSRTVETEGGTEEPTTLLPMLSAISSRLLGSRRALARARAVWVEQRPSERTHCILERGGVC